MGMFSDIWGGIKKAGQVYNNVTDSIDAPGVVDAAGNAINSGLASADIANARFTDYTTPGNQSYLTQNAVANHSAPTNMIDLLGLATQAGLIRPPKSQKPSKPSKNKPSKTKAQHPAPAWQGPLPNAQNTPQPGSQYDAAIQSLMNSGPAAPTAAQDKAYAKQSQHVINNAILASRHEYDQAIINAKIGYKHAGAQVTAATAAMDPLMQGARRGFEMNRQSQANDIAANTAQAHDAVTTDQSILDKLGASSLGGTGQQLVNSADDTANAQVAAQQAAASSISNDAAASSSNMASDISATSMLAGQEAHNNLVRDQQLQIGNLRAQRAAAIAGAKSTTQGELIAARDKASGDAEAATSRNQALAVQLMGMRQSAVNAQATADTAKSNAIAKTSGDAISNWIKMQGSQIKSVGIDPATGKPVTQYGPAFEKGQSFASLVAGGVDPATAARLTGFDPNPKPVPAAPNFIGQTLADMLSQASR